MIKLSERTRKRAQDFTSSGSWTNPGGVLRVRVTLIGAAVGNSGNGTFIAGDTSAGALVAHGGRGTLTGGVFDSIANPTAISGYVNTDGIGLSIVVGSGANGGSNGSAVVEWEQ